ncbi:ATP-binding cassette, subfamily B, MsbA [Formivibrio citricus]|uniref:ATP-binding cassette, subfamily B, MsbA n=1 Tax=Formivibrio citricus TaxID=83765 RepID=A0A1I4VMJ4_9NEIS|nr:lipid A export permease/ATP-binding protein MsbA [Formivibrio citricus]SFN02410.1 ATP-binding cassette, subfamily B, MsbA [Formivibrio citricus]
MSSRALYFRILGYINRYRSAAALAILCMVVAGGVDAAMMRLLKNLIDGFQQLSTGQQELWIMPTVLFGLGLLRLGTSFTYEYLSAWLASRVMFDLRGEVFDRLIRMPAPFFDRSSTGVLLSRVTFDVNQIMDAGLNVLTVIVRDSVLSIGLIAVMLWTDWRLTLFCLLLLPSAAVSIRVVSKRQRRLSRETQDTMGEMTRILDESLGGQRIVKIFGGMPYEAGRFSTANNLVRQLHVKRNATSSMNSGFTVFLIAVAIAALIYFAGLRAQEGVLTAGAFVSFMGSMMLLQQPVKNLSKINDQLHKGLAAAESVFAIIDQPIEEDTGSREVERAQGKLEYRNVVFRYAPDSDRTALDSLNLTVRPGETVALVGPSGGGKTTLVNLLPRFYEPSAGQILLDDVPLMDYRLANLRRQIALVSQDVVLFNDTVAANIAYGADAVDMDKVRAAAKAAHALEFIENMQDGFGAMLGENGVRLSGGQRQRIAIARALYKDAPILILDEATSALDTESERQVQAALDNLMKGRTTLVIAHRLSTIENADRIVVLQHGKVAEEGRHADLLAANGIYARMHAVQFAGGE